MKTFRLQNEPISWQISVRLTNLISTYGSESVLDCLHHALKAIQTHADDMVIDDPELCIDKNDSLAMISISVIQMIRHFGPAVVQNHVNEIYTRKVG